jgi:threonine/homoserine/homoserine lactone efflux protein
MNELAKIFVWSFTIGLTGAVMPGPLLALTLKESATRGKTASLWLCSGHSICELALVLLFVGGVTPWIPVEKIIGPVGLVGGLVLFWMAWGAYRQAREPFATPETAGARSTGRNLLVSGGAVSVSNPYWTLWWLTVGLELLLRDARPAGMAGVGAFYFGHILSDFAWFGLVGFMIGGSRKMLEGKLYRYLILVCAALLAGFGVWFVSSGMGTIVSRLAE